MGPEVAIAAIALLALGKRGEQRQPEPPPAPPPQQGPSPAKVIADVAGIVGTVAGVATPIVTTLVTGGTAAGVTGGATAGAAAHGAAEAAAAAAEASSEAAETASEVSALAAAETVGGLSALAAAGIFAAVVAAVLAIIGIGSLIGSRVRRWNAWTGNGTQNGAAAIARGRILLGERDMFEELATQVNPTYRVYPNGEDNAGLPDQGWVPNYHKTLVNYVQLIDSVQLPAGLGVDQVLAVCRVYGVEREAAFQRHLDAFYASRGFNNRTAQGISFNPSEATFWNEVVENFCQNDPHYTLPGLGLGAALTYGAGRFAAASNLAYAKTWAGTQDLAARLITSWRGNYGDFVTAAQLDGQLKAMTRAAIDGFGWNAGWPGDGEFTGAIVRMCGLTWPVEVHYINGVGPRWVAVEPVTQAAFDVVRSRELENQPVVYPKWQGAGGNPGSYSF